MTVLAAYLAFWSLALGVRVPELRPEPLVTTEHLAEVWCEWGAPVVVVQPNFARKASVRQAALVMLHETCHVALSHHCAKSTTPREHWEQEATGCVEAYQQTYRRLLR